MVHGTRKTPVTRDDPVEPIILLRNMIAMQLWLTLVLFRLASTSAESPVLR